MLERIRPEQGGIHPGAITAYLQVMQTAGYFLNSFMMLRNGKVCYQLFLPPFGPDIKHNLYSCTKSVTATAVGFAVAEGLFRLEDKIADLLPHLFEKAPHPYTVAMTVEHLLTMSTPFSRFVDPVTDDWTREFLNADPDVYPGCVFDYNTSGTHTLCEVIQHRGGVTVLDYLRPRLFEPLGISDLEWEVSPAGINRGGGGLRMTTESMAKFGLLYLKSGVYNGRQVLPPGWAELATARHVDNYNTREMVPGTNGYGFQFWHLQESGFACLGLGGQTIAAFPQKDVVFVTTANGMGHASPYLPLNAMWACLYPALEDGPIPLDDTAFQKLVRDWGGRETWLPTGLPGGAPPENLSGKPLPLERNPLGYDTVTFELSPTQGTLCFCRGAEKDRLTFGMGTHVGGTVPFQKYACEKQYWGWYTFPHDRQPRLRSRCGSAAVWTDRQTLLIHAHLLETVQSFVITCRFGEQAVTVHIRPYGGFEYDGIPCALTHLREKKQDI